MKRVIAVVAGGVLLTLGSAGPALACGGLVGPNGAVRLVRTATLAAYHDGVEHYVTSFQFAGAETDIGSIVPLPDLPSKVERGGDWTLQRLQQEVQPQVEEGEFRALSAAEDAGGGVTVHLETQIDALDIAVLEGGGRAVADWAEQHGYDLSPDAPEVLEFYARRSPFFMAARFNAAAAEERGSVTGDGTPIHLTIPTDDPWVPLRILGLAKPDEEIVEADVFLLTDDKPTLLTGPGLVQAQSRSASSSLLADLRSDKGMEWVPDDMWLSYLRLDVPAGDLVYDLAIDATGDGAPSVVDTGLTTLQDLVSTFDPDPADTPWGLVIAGLITATAIACGTVVWLARGSVSTRTLNARQP